jgi:hypothetical protein
MLYATRADNGPKYFIYIRFCGPKMAEERYSSSFTGRKWAKVRYMHQDIRAANRPKYIRLPGPEVGRNKSYKSGFLGRIRHGNQFSWSGNGPVDRQKGP